MHAHIYANLNMGSEFLFVLCRHAHMHSPTKAIHARTHAPQCGLRVPVHLVLPDLVHESSDNVLCDLVNLFVVIPKLGAFSNNLKVDCDASVVSNLPTAVESELKPLSGHVCTWDVLDVRNFVHNYYDA